MNKNVFRGILIITFLFSILYFIADVFYPSGHKVAYYLCYRSLFINEEPSTLTNLLRYTSLLLYVISVAGMFLFLAPFRLLFISSLLLTIPGYFTDPHLIYTSMSKILYDAGMIGSGVILATMYLEPINRLFKKSGNKTSGLDANNESGCLTDSS